MVSPPKIRKETESTQHDRACVCVCVRAPWRSSVAIQRGQSQQCDVHPEAQERPRPVLGWTVRRIHPDAPAPPQPPAHPRALRGGGRSVGPEVGAHASAPPLSLDENANLGTVMRYEEIGEWGWPRGRCRVGEGPGLHALGRVCHRVCVQKNGCSPAKTTVSLTPPFYLLTGLTPLPRR